MELNPVQSLYVQDKTFKLHGEYMPMDRNDTS